MWSMLSKIKCNMVKYCSFSMSCCGDKVEIDIKNDRKQRDEDIEVSTCCFSFKKVSHIHEDTND